MLVLPCGELMVRLWIPSSPYAPSLFFSLLFVAHSILVVRLISLRCCRLCRICRFCYTLQLIFFAMLYLSMTGMAQASLSLRAIYVPPSLLRNLAQQLVWCVVDGFLFCR